MSSTPITVRNATDTSAVEGAPSRNYADSTRLRVRADTGAGTVNYSYIHFARPFPLGATIQSATLKLYGAGTWPSASRTITIKRVTESWKVKRVTWNNKPTVTATGSVSDTQTGARADGDVWEFDVTSLLQLVADGTGWYGWRIETNESTAQRRFYSAQAQTQYKPVLEVTYSLAPDAPTDLWPSENRAVSVSHPVLRFDFTDTAGNTELAAIQVQINSTDVWTAPTFDSGTVTTTEPSLDLSTTAYAGLTAGSSTYWRVRVQDGSGLWSDWSEATQFSRTAKGTVTISNPPASPSNYVEENTPPITWSVSGATQVAWRVTIADALGNWIYTTGKRVGTDVSWTLPAKSNGTALLQRNETYTAIVDVWDDVDREHTPDDPIYISASRDFTFQFSATPTVVTGLAVEDLSPIPAVKLTWSRATQPDTFYIERDGVPIVPDDLDSTDMLVSGTSYEYTDYGVSPRTSHTWEVAAVVNNQTSDSNPTVTTSISPHGVWLMDLDAGTNVVLLGKDSGSWSMGEDAETLLPLGAQAPIRVTQSLRGFEGSVSGQIMDYNGTTVETYESRLWDIKEKPGSTFQLVLSNMSIPVIIGNLVVAPGTESEITKTVSFDFWQVGDFNFRPVL